MRKSLVLTALTAVASVSLLAGCSSSTPSTEPSSSSAPTPSAPVVNIPGAIPGELARATVTDSGAPQSTAVAKAAADVLYVVKGQCSSPTATDTITYTVMVDGKAASGKEATGKITCDGSYVLAPTVAIAEGSEVNITLTEPGAGVTVAYAIVEPQQ